MAIQLTGIDLNDPLPGTKRELAPNRGSSGGATASRALFIGGNKVAGTGTSTADGLGLAMDTPVAIGGGEDEVIQRYGYHSELLLLYRTAVSANPDVQVWTAFVQPGTATATVDFTFEENGIRVTATTRTAGQTGVEMEALTAVSVACLTIYDMLKAVDRAMRIEAVRLTAKSGGASGEYKAE